MVPIFILLQTVFSTPIINDVPLSLQNGAMLPPWEFASDVDVQPGDIVQWLTTGANRPAPALIYCGVVSVREDHRSNPVFLILNVGFVGQRRRYSLPSSGSTRRHRWMGTMPCWGLGESAESPRLSPGRRAFLLHF